MNKVVKIITKETGPLVNIAIAKKSQGVIHGRSSSHEILRQKESRLVPKVAHKRESLTAVLLQIIIKGDKAKLNDATSESLILSFGSSVAQNTVSAITIIINNADKAEGSLADRDPYLSQISLPGIE